MKVFKPTDREIGSSCSHMHIRTSASVSCDHKFKNHASWNSKPHCFESADLLLMQNGTIIRHSIKNLVLTWQRAIALCKYVCIISFPSSKGAIAPNMLQLTLCAWAVSSPWAFAKASCNRSSVSIYSKQKKQNVLRLWICEKIEKKIIMSVHERWNKLPVAVALAPELAWSLARNAWRQGCEGSLSYERLWEKTILAPMLPIPPCATPTKSVHLYIH